MSIATKFKMFGWFWVWAVVANDVFEYAPRMREDAALVCGVMMICFGVALKELKQ